MLSQLIYAVDILVVMVEFPGRANDPKAFRFPQDLEDAIRDWSLYVTATAATPRPRRLTALRNDFRIATDFATKSVVGATFTVTATAANVVHTTASAAAEEAAALKLQSMERGRQARRRVRAVQEPHVNRAAETLGLAPGVLHVAGKV